MAELQTKEDLELYAKIDRQKRLDDFAKSALIGLYAAQIHGLNARHASDFAAMAYDIADAMLAERAKRGDRS